MAELTPNDKFIIISAYTVFITPSPNHQKTNNKILIWTLLLFIDRYQHMSPQKEIPRLNTNQDIQAPPQHYEAPTPVWITPSQWQQISSQLLIRRVTIGA